VFCYNDFVLMIILLIYAIVEGIVQFGFNSAISHMTTTTGMRACMDADWELQACIFGRRRSPCMHCKSCLNPLILTSRNSTGLANGYIDRGTDLWTGSGQRKTSACAWLQIDGSARRHHQAPLHCVLYKPTLCHRHNSDSASMQT